MAQRLPNTPTSRSIALRAALVWFGATGLAAGVAAHLVPALLAAARLTWTAPGRMRFPDLLVAWAEATLLAAAVWWVAVVTAVLLESLGSRRPLARSLGCPLALRRLLLALLGVGLTAASVSPAQADPQPVTSPRHGPATAVRLDRLPLPDRPLGHHGHRGGERAGSHGPGARRIRVVSGDSLWALAAGQLGPRAPDAAVARHSRQIYAVNRAVVGPDPDLLHPGQVLRLPDAHPDHPTHRASHRKDLS